MNSSLKCLNTTFFRGISTTASLRDSRSLMKFKKLQAEYQCEDGLPIFLKRGFCDRMLYGSTLLGCFVGLGMTFLTIYDFAKPPSWKNKTC